MQTLNVQLGDRSYPIYIGRDLLGDADLYRHHIPGRSVLIVSNDVVEPLYMKSVQTALSGLRTGKVVLPDGEEHKTLSAIEHIVGAALQGNFDRNCTLVALGGGVVGDITGFAAASYQRGVHFIQVPTTLLAQVDSSVGGKTGVNHALGKNMIGAFYQPRCVIIDTATLATLPDRELCAGLAEVIKYGLICDYGFFCWLEEHMDALLARDETALVHAIRTSCETKAIVVAADETERSGRRALLNLGHTFGHAIETGMGYGAWLHGEAVGCGMVMAAQMSERLGWITDADVDRVRTLIERARLPVTPPSELAADRFLALMSVDKKVMDGQLKLVLMRGIGDATLTADFRLDTLRALLAAH